MAHIVQITKLQDGAKFATYRLYIHGDAQTQSEVFGQVVVDPAELTPPQAQKVGLSIDRVWYDLSGFLVRLRFDSAPSHPVWTFGTSTTYQDFREIGGLQDVSGLDGTGILLLDTFNLGVDSANKLGSMIIQLRKG